jgi:hypothetical protein
MPELLAIDTGAGMWLEGFVTAHCPELSRSRVQELVDGGFILVHGKPAKSSETSRWGSHHPSFPVSEIRERAFLAGLHRASGLCVEVNPPKALIGSSIGIVQVAEGVVLLPQLGRAP